ncbi:MAG: IS110 family transposase [Verrucomicrobia bacterium]|jgi:transposase|nr:IS110 family transposase [Verrucomicrobiota bacterium]
MIKYVGADVHGQTTCFCVLDSSGQKIMETTVATTSSALESFVRALSGEVHVAFEEGTQAQWLYYLLSRQVKRVVVCDPKKLSQRRSGISKTDKIDAERIADLLRKDELSPVYHDYGGLDALRHFVRNHQTLTRDSSRVKLQLKALYRANGIPTPGVTVYSRTGREAYVDLLVGRGLRARAEAQYVRLDVLDGLVEQARTDMLGEAKKYKVRRLLQTVPGIGPVRSAMLIAQVGTPHRFPNKRAFWAYCGLAIVQHGTGLASVTKSGKIVLNAKALKTRGLNRNRNPHLKDLFKGAVLTAIQKPEFATYLESFTARGLHVNVAKVAVARKLATIVLTVWKKGERYDPSRLAVKKNA